MSLLLDAVFLTFSNLIALGLGITEEDIRLTWWLQSLLSRASTLIHSEFKTLSLKSRHHFNVVFIDWVLLVHLGNHMHPIPVFTLVNNKILLIWLFHLVINLFKLKKKRYISIFIKVLIFYPRLKNLNIHFILQFLLLSHVTYSTVVMTRTLRM